MSNSRAEEGNTNEVTGKHSNVALLSLPWLRACRATAEQEDTAVPQHIHSTHGTGTSMLENCCGAALAECTWLCLSLRCDSDLLHWQILEAITTPHLFPCSQTWCKHREGKPDRIPTDSGKEKGFQFATPGHYLLSRAAGKELH